MNVFRFLGDASHFAAIIILLLKIWKTRSCAGLSGRSQIAFAIVFTTRYVDLLTSYVSLYNSLAKIIFIFSSYATLYLIYFRFKATHDGNHDTFRLEFLFVPCALLALIVNHRFQVVELPSCLSCFLLAKLEKQKPSLLTTYFRLVLTVACTYSTGYTGIMSKTITI
ncbi:unnamed protein product [Schistosoma rodhaini]|uniref:ER lumen protein-retaining receptor n=1 Tax=Schistosoma rodhaini TaxID=6188 RepID=A0AA85FCB9_9TREM|nr:unnamed protein product [Schistosoma rodhaini]